MRCLEGGAWDRSTSWGIVASLEEAAGMCEAGPVWRRQLDAMSDEMRAALGRDDSMNKIRMIELGILALLVGT